MGPGFYTTIKQADTFGLQKQSPRGEQLHRWIHRLKGCRGSFMALASSLNFCSASSKEFKT